MATSRIEKMNRNGVAFIKVITPNDGFTHHANFFKSQRDLKKVCFPDSGEENTVGGEYPTTNFVGSQQDAKNFAASND
jgi:hypothetical protein